MRVYGPPVLVDLVSGGSPSVSVTPGTTVQSVSFTMGTQLPALDGDNWPLAKSIVTRVTNTFDQAAAGGSVVNWDELFRTNDSFDLLMPSFVGTYMRKEVYNGPSAKHIIEFFSLGYRYYDHARAQIPAADGDTTIDLYTALPFSNDNFTNAHQFFVWLGWMQNLILTVNIATATTIAAVSTGAVTKAPCTIKAWIEAYPAMEPCVPLINQWTRFTQAAAAGSTSMLLQNVGQANGLTGVMNGSRLAALVELMNVLGYGATSTSDNYTQFQSSDLGQPVANNVDGFVGSFLSQIGHRGPISGIGASTPIHDGGGNPYTMAATPNNALNATTLGYLAWRFPATDQLLQLVLRWRLGNLNITRFFTSTPTTGSYIVLCNEIRQTDATMRASLLAAANIPASVRAKMRRPETILGERIPIRDR